MKSVYLMRHGQTLFNQRRKVQGACDSPLTELGIKQAKVAKQYFIDHKITFDSAYSSTSERASDTLEIITDISYHRVKGLKEWDFGTFEGESEDLNPQLPYGDFFADYGGEREEDFKKRFSDTMFELVKNDSNRSILVVAHGAACAQFYRTWEHTSDVKRTGKKIGNCAVFKYEFDSDTFKLQEIVSHDFSDIE